VTPIRFWFDPISPYAWLAFERLPQALVGCSYVVEYRPILFAGLLKHWGQLGPAEIAPKREWTYRQAAWLARQQGLELRAPAAHPFNPLGLLRLLIASGLDGLPNRLQCEIVLRHAWCSGAVVDAPAELAALATRLQPRCDPQGDAVKQQLRSDTEAAIARGVFGVPTLELPSPQEGSTPRLFWGADSLDMAAACLRGDLWFEGPWNAAARVPQGVQRPR